MVIMITSASTNRANHGPFRERSVMSCCKLVFCGGGTMRSRVLKKVTRNRQEAATPQKVMVNCQPKRSLPPPSHLTSECVTAVTKVLPLKAKMKRRPLIVERSCGSLDMTPERALYGMLMPV